MTIEQEFAEYALAAIHPTVRAWYAREEITDQLKAALAGDFDRLTNVALSEGFAQRCPIEGARPEAYRHRVLTTPDGLRLLAGIRFKALDTTQPFVAVLHTSRPLTTGREVRSVVAHIVASFGVFRPRWVQLYQSSHAPFEPAGVPGIAAGKRYLAAPLAEMAARPPPSSIARVQLVPAAVADIYPAYAEIYRHFHASTPALREFVRQESPDDLAECQAEGTLFSILVDGAWTGVLGVSRGTAIGLRGYSVNELILAANGRGQRLAPAVQYRFARTVRQTAGDTLYGTIQPENLPARCAALRSGRIDLGGYFWIDCPNV